METERKKKRREMRKGIAEREEKRKENEEWEARGEPPPILGTHSLAKC